MADETTAAPAADSAPASEPSPTLSNPVQTSSAPAQAVSGPTPGVESSPTAPGDWRSGLDGDDLSYAERFASPQDLAKNSHKLWRDNSGMVRLPELEEEKFRKATALGQKIEDKRAEVDEKYRKAIGAGLKPEDYKLLPEGADAADHEIATKLAAIMHEHRIPTAAAEKMRAAVDEVGQALEAERERVAVEGRAKAEAGLRKEWGRDFEANGNLASRAAKEFGGPNFAQFLNSAIVDGVKLGDHPEFMRVFGTIGRRMGESSLMGPVGEERTSLKTSIDSKTREMHEAYRKGDRDKSNALNAELLDLNGKLYGNRKIVGRDSRTV